MALDGLMRRVYRQELLRRERSREHDVGAVDDLPDPYDPRPVDAFVALLRTPFPGSAAPRIPRYLHALHHGRPDIQGAFPSLAGLAGNHYLWWVREMASATLGLPPELVPAADEIEGARRPPAPTGPGVRLVGYLAAELGVGEAGRAWRPACVRRANRSVTVTETVTSNRQRHRDGGRHPRSDRASGAGAATGGATSNWCASTPTGCRSSSTAWVAAFTRDATRSACGPGRSRSSPTCSRRRPAWSTRCGPTAPTPGGAIAGAVDRPVHTVPPPVLVERPPAPRSRAELGLPDGFVFLFCFDFFSVAERKNPVGRRRGVPPGVRPREAAAAGHQDHQRRQATLPELERLRLRAPGRPDIHVLDGYHDRRRPAGADGGVRRLRVAAPGRGVRLHDGRGDARRPKPVIATGYSGNLEFMDERNSFLVGHDLVAIPRAATRTRRGRCGPSPTSTRRPS